VSSLLQAFIRFRTIDIEQANGFGQSYKELALAKAAPNWMAFLENGPRSVGPTQLLVTRITPSSTSSTGDYDVSESNRSSRKPRVRMQF
jgi:hypothetical protein